MENHYQVIIIGAGVSGCSAARRLLKEGVTRILILEAADKPGGRVRSVITGCGYADLGAHYIHGKDGNPVCKQLEVNGMTLHRIASLPSHELFKTLVFYRPPGEEIEPSIISCVLELLDKIGELIESDWDPEHMPIQQFKEMHFTRICEDLAVTGNLKTCYVAMLQAMETILGVLDGLWPNDRSCIKSEMPFDDCGGGDFVLSENMYSAVFERWLLPDTESFIKMNSKVKNIDWSCDKVAVTTSRGIIYTADHVIVTPSVGVLQKYHKTLFLPSLPPERIQALDPFTLGKAEKMFFEFDYQFWQPELEANPNFGGFVFPYLNHDDKIADLEDLIEEILGSQEDWWKQMLSTCFETQLPHILTVFINGEPACDVHKYDDETVLKVFGLILSYCLQKEIPSPKKVTRSNWVVDEHFLGSYLASTLSYKCEHAETMLQPLSVSQKPAVLFAGEAYHPEFPSTMHGALSTGESQADKILQYIKTTDRSSRIASHIE